MALWPEGCLHPRWSVSYSMNVSSEDEDGRPRRTLEPAAGGMEEVLTGVGSKELMAYGLCRSC